MRIEWPGWPPLRSRPSAASGPSAGQWDRPAGACTPIDHVPALIDDDILAAIAALSGSFHLTMTKYVKDLDHEIGEIVTAHIVHVHRHKMRGAWRIKKKGDFL